MLDLKYIRQNPEEVKEALDKRSGNYAASIDRLLELDFRKRALKTQLDDLQAQKNKISKSINSAEQALAVKAKVAELDQVMSDLQQQENLSILEEQIEDLLLDLPNLPAPEVPVGKDETENQLVKTWGEVPAINNPKSHWELGEALGLLDFEQTVKVAGARMSSFIGFGAKLQRALVQFMLDSATEAGYTEISPPYIINAEMLRGTGQLPKFADDLYQLADSNQYLIPTGEVPLTGFYAVTKNLTESDLPKKLCAYSPCFRREAGAAGKDTRGLIRQHQFDKVELVHICKSEDSWTEHESLVEQAESILQSLGLTYRKVLLCTGDMGFAAAKCYDLEVWFPAQSTYREISSCSNCTDFQARRLNFKFKRKSNEYVHTLNGSGLAIGRTWAAILENYQLPNQEGFAIPAALQKYLGMEVYKAKLD